METCPLSWPAETEIFGDLRLNQMRIVKKTKTKASIVHNAMPIEKKKRKREHLQRRIIPM